MAKPQPLYDPSFLRKVSYKVAWGAVKLFPFSVLILGRSGLHMLYDKVVKPCLCKKHV